MAGARPDTQGVPLTRWSLPRLSLLSRRGGHRQVSPRHLGALLAEAGLSFQRTRTWKASPDPDYEAKAARMLALCEQPPQDGVVVSFDQMGPVSLRPTAGAGWAPQGPARAPARRLQPPRTASATSSAPTTSTPTGCASGCAPSAPAATCSPSCARSGSCYPARQRIYWIQDNLSANWIPDIRAFAAANRIELVPTPTYASYLNPVECHFRRSASSSSATPTTSTGTPSPTRSPATSRYRNGDHRDRRLAAAEARHRIAA